MKMNVTFLNIFLMLLYSFIAIIHSLGSYILLSIYKNGTQSVNQLYIISLSISELLISILHFLNRLIACHAEKGTHNVDVNFYILSCETGICIIYYLNMFYITIDKLMEILLNIRYPIYWNEEKAKTLLMVTWFLGIIFSLSMIFALTFASFHNENSFSKYFYPTIDFMFLAIALLTYGFIFNKFKHTRTSPTGNKHKSLFNVFLNSKFYISVLLISTFLLFTIVPDLIFMLCITINGNISEDVRVTCYIFYAISYVSDAWIYIIIQKSVRTRFQRICRNLKNWFCFKDILFLQSRTSMLETSV